MLPKWSFNGESNAIWLDLQDGSVRCACARVYEVENASVARVRLKLKFGLLLCTLIPQR